ncbi:MAG: anti-sigma F factor [Firmicutes bacterium]|nr:anti-sigma F factor [Bacillota bacterium]
MKDTIHSKRPVAVPNVVKLEFFSRSENVSLARLAAAAMAAERQISMAELDELKVAVSEAVSNAIIHGYQGKEDGLITMTLISSAQRLSISVHDDGVGIEDVEQAMKANFSSSGERMGLGFAFMQAFTDGVEVTSYPGAGATVVLHKDFL